MITSLRDKIRPDTLESQTRTGGRRLARRLYLSAVIVLVSVAVYYSIGGFFFLDAEGIVTIDRTIVSSLYNARVISVQVKIGQPVKKGALLLTMQSPDLLVELGRQQTHRQDIIRRDNEIRSRLASIGTLKPQAASRNRKAASYEAETSRVGKEGFASSSHLAGTARDSYEAARDLSLLKTEERSLRDEMVVQTKIRAESDALINELLSIYDNGNIHSPTTGDIGVRIPERGEVVRAGEPLLAILRGLPYVLAYLPTARTYSVIDGQQVIVSDGSHRTIGTVERFGNVRSKNVSEVIPKELQSQFGTIDVRQVFRVRFNHEPPFSLFSKVKIVEPWSPSNVSSLLLEGLARVLRMNRNDVTTSTPKPNDRHEVRG